MAGGDVTLKIPRPLYERLAKVIEGTGFRSVTEFAVYVLRRLSGGYDVPPPYEGGGQATPYDENAGVR